MASQAMPARRVRRVRGGRQRRALRAGLVGLPVLLPCSVALLATDAGGAARFVVWSVLWTLAGLVALPRLDVPVLMRWALAGAAGLAESLVAWFVLVGCGFPEAMPAAPVVALLPLLHPGTRARVCRSVHPARSRAGSDGERISTSALAAWAASSSYLLVAAYASFRPRALPPRTSTMFQDLFWHLGIAADLKRHVVPHALESQVGVLDYHWLSDALMAGDSLGANVSTAVVVQRLWFLPVLLVAPALVVGLARQVSGSWASAWPAVVITTFGSAVQVVPWQPTGPSATFSFLSPSQTFGVIPTLVATSALVALWRRGRMSWLQNVGLFVLFVLCAGSKPSIVPVLIGGVCLSLLVTELRPSSTASAPRGLQLRILGTMLAAQVVGMLVFAGGSAGSQVRLFGHFHRSAIITQLTGHPHPAGHGPFVPPGLTVLAVVVLLVVVLASAGSYAVVAFGARVPASTWRTDPTPSFLLGCWVASFAAFCLLDHTGQSEAYFPMTAMPLVAVLAGWGFASAWDARPDARRRDAVIGLVVGLAVIAALRLIPTPTWHGSTTVVLGWVALPLALTVTALLLGRWWLRRGGSAVTVMTAVLVVSLNVPVATSVARTSTGLTPPTDRVFAGSVRPWESAPLVWLRTHTPADAVVATNVHCDDVVARPHCVSSAYWTSGFSERQMFIGSWGYTDGAQSRAGLDGYPAIQQAYPDRAAFELNERVFYHPSAAAVGALRARGVSYLYADSRVAPVSPELARHADVVGRWQDVTVYRLRGARR